MSIPARWLIYVPWLCLTSSSNLLSLQANDSDGDLKKNVDRLNNLSFRMTLLLETIPLLVVQIILIKITAIETQALDWIIISEVLHVPYTCMHTLMPHPTHPPTDLLVWTQSSTDDKRYCDANL